MKTKETNPKDAVGAAKVPLSVLSAPVMAEVGVGMMEGARKYGRHNYRVAGVRGSVYYDAAMRHLMSWWEGEDTDPDSGLSHITKAICGLFVLRDCMIRDMMVDDRPPPSPEEWMAGLNARAAALLEKYPDAHQPIRSLRQAPGGIIRSRPMDPTEPRSLWDELSDYYTPDEAREWLTSPHPQLEGAIPAELMAKGEFDPLFQIMDRLASAGYL